MCFHNLLITGTCTLCFYFCPLHVFCMPIILYIPITSKNPSCSCWVCLNWFSLHVLNKASLFYTSIKNGFSNDHGIWGGGVSVVFHKQEISCPLKINCCTPVVNMWWWFVEVVFKYMLYSFLNPKGTEWLMCHVVGLQLYLYNYMYLVVFILSLWVFSYTVWVFLCTSDNTWCTLVFFFNTHKTHTYYVVYVCVTLEVMCG